nr:sperm associated antigen 8 [Solea senegalensis]XP_043867736.1 sperm associated antigen 8 [Solea senegalensis]
METHKFSDVFVIDKDAKLESITTAMAAYLPPKSPGVRTKGTRKELLEKNIAHQVIRLATDVKSNAPTPETHFCSMTHRSFTVDGFEPVAPTATYGHDYKTDEAVTFWSENYPHTQGVTAVRNLEAPFRKSACFSKPINERLDDDSPSDH